MPIFIEVEDTDGTIFEWVTDSETLDKLRGHLGKPQNVYSLVASDLAA